MRDSNRAIARHLHQAVYRDRHRDIWSPNGALTGAYSGTGTRKAARFPEKIPPNAKQCEANVADPAAVPLERRPGPPEPVKRNIAEHPREPPARAIARHSATGAP